MSRNLGSLPQNKTMFDLNLVTKFRLHKEAHQFFRRRNLANLFKISCGFQKRWDQLEKPCGVGRKMTENPVACFWRTPPWSRTARHMVLRPPVFASWRSSILLSRHVQSPDAGKIFKRQGRGCLLERGGKKKKRKKKKFGTGREKTLCCPIKNWGNLSFDRPKQI